MESPQHRDALKREGIIRFVQFRENVRVLPAYAVAKLQRNYELVLIKGSMRNSPAFLWLWALAAEESLPTSTRKSHDSTNRVW